MHVNIVNELCYICSVDILDESICTVIYTNKIRIGIYECSDRCHNVRGPRHSRAGSSLDQQPGRAEREPSAAQRAGVIIYSATVIIQNMHTLRLHYWPPHYCYAYSMVEAEVPEFLSFAARTEVRRSEAASPQPVIAGPAQCGAG